MEGGRERDGRGGGEREGYRTEKEMERGMGREGEGMRERG